MALSYEVIEALKKYISPPPPPPPTKTTTGTITRPDGYRRR